jgi:hypothetical protein
MKNLEDWKRRAQQLALSRIGQSPRQTRMLVGQARAMGAEHDMQAFPVADGWTPLQNEEGVPYFLPGISRPGVDPDVPY